MYQIFVDRFYNGDPTNDVEDDEYIYIGAPCKKIKDWSQAPASMDIRNFYGGDLQGVIDKLDYLQDLGIEVIYFNPLFVSPSNHKYDIQDYDYIDPHYGKIVVDDGEVLPKGAKDNIHATKYQQRTGDLRNLEASNQLFAKLVDAMHQRGMKVILDGVFNHCGSFNKWMDRERIYEPQPDYPKGAYVSAQSPYRSFFLFHNNQDSAWPYNGKYGDIIHCRSCRMRSHRIWKITLCGSERNGCLHLIILTAGDWMSQRISDSAMNIIIYSGNVSVKRSKV